VWTTNLDGTGQTRLADGGGSTYDDGSPTFSPDGTTIAYSLSTVPCCSTFSMYSDIYTMDADDGSGQRRLTRGDDSDEGLYVLNMYPDFSPDGSQIAFGRRLVNRAPGYNIVYTMNASDGSGLTSVASGYYGPYGGLGGPAWSPDGGKLAYTKTVYPDPASPEGQQYGPDYCEVFVVKPDRTEETNLTNRPEACDHSPD
jgi:Tol biopolymer transport system component